MTQRITHRTTLCLEIEVEVEGDYTPYDPGKCFGPPELCYPPEGGTFEIESIIVVPTGEKLILPDSLDQKVADELYDEIISEIADASADID